MPKLLMVAPAPVIETAKGLRLDIKFVEGGRAHVRGWDGPVEFVLWRGSSGIPFGADYVPGELEFGVRVLDAGAAVPREWLADQDVVCASADSAHTFDLVSARRESRPKVAYTVEYTLRTRLDILRLDRARSWPRRLVSAARLYAQERTRRSCFRKADALQVNGYPAYEAFRDLNPRTMLYLDNRMRPGMFATADEMAARATRLRSGGPLRLVHSGRLETMKGAQDLIPAATQFAAKGIAFTLDIFGTGSLEGEIRQGIAAAGLADRVRLHAPLDFETELVPWQRTHADVFLSCHRQGDPSCTYLESMGCGLPVLGYRNEMWERLAETSRGGWAVALGDPSALSQALKTLSREEIIATGERALAFATAHDFEKEFRNRMNHLKELLT